MIWDLHLIRIRSLTLDLVLVPILLALLALAVQGSNTIQMKIKSTMSMRSNTGPLL